VEEAAGRQDVVAVQEPPLVQGALEEPGEVGCGVADRQDGRRARRLNLSGEGDHGDGGVVPVGAAADGVATGRHEAHKRAPVGAVRVDVVADQQVAVGRQIQFDPQSQASGQGDRTVDPDPALLVVRTARGAGLLMQEADDADGVEPGLSGHRQHLCGVVASRQHARAVQRERAVPQAQKGAAAMDEQGGRVRRRCRDCLGAGLDDVGLHGDGTAHRTVGLAGDQRTGAREG
jgi:hypothetical protein